jgi:hypothetical protein
MPITTMMSETQMIQGIVETFPPFFSVEGLDALFAAPLVDASLVDGPTFELASRDPIQKHAILRE